MKKIKVLCLLVVSLFTGLFVFNSKVDAKEVLKTAQATDISGNVIGSIKLYDDYTITYNYTYRVKDIKIWVCLSDICFEESALIAPGQTYIDGNELLYSLSNYIIQDSNNDVTYHIKAQGDFKISETNPFGSLITLSYDVEIKAPPKGDDKSDDIVNEAKRVEEIFNTWVIPSIYIAIGLLLIIKLILLCMDLAKYSDNPDMRREKIRGFVYVFIGAVIVTIVNSSIGVITGLFD